MSGYSFVWLQGGATGMLLSRLAGIGVGMAIEGCEERDCADGEDIFFILAIVGGVK